MTTRAGTNLIVDEEDLCHKNSDKASNAKIATLLEIGLPPGEDHYQSPHSSAVTEMATADFALDLPPTANAQPGADYCRISYEGEIFKPVVVDVLQPRLRRPEKLGFKRRNRRRTELVRYMGERIIAPEKYRPMLGCASLVARGSLGQANYRGQSQVCC